MTFLLIVTVSSMVLAAIMSAIAWRIAAAERRRSEARIAALAAEIHAPAAPRAVAAQASGARRADVGLPGDGGIRADSPRRARFPAERPASSWDEDLPIRAVVDHRSPTPELFAQAPSRSRGPIVAVVGALVVVAALTIAVVLGRGASWRRTTPAPAAASPAPAAAPATAAATPAAAAPEPTSVPLELVALGHDRVGDRLTVRGVIRNPSSTRAVESLTAVVFAFNADGGFLTSGRAIIESSALGPGGESTFAVVVPGAAAVGRYRVSFRSGDRIVPHVDRRGPAKVSS